MVFISLISALFAFNGLILKTSNLDLIDHSIPDIENFISSSQNFGTPNIIIMKVKIDKHVGNQKIIEEITNELNSNPRIKSVLASLPEVPKSNGKIEYTPIMSKDHKSIFILIQPLDILSEIQSIEPLITSLNELKFKFHDSLDVDITFTGLPVYAIDDKWIIQHDIENLSGISLILVAIIFYFAFKQIFYTFWAIITLIISVLITLGAITVYPGHLTLLTSSFAAIMCGLGIDFAIHIIHMYEQQNNTDKFENLRSTLKSLSRGLFSGYTTTALIFLSLVFCEFKGFRELGMVGFMGITICFWCMVTLFPCFVTLTNRIEKPKHFRFKLPDILKNKIMGWVSISLFIGCIFNFSLKFDSNYLNLQPIKSESVSLEMEIQNNSDFSCMFAIFSSDSMVEISRITEILKAHPLIKQVFSPAFFSQEAYNPQTQVNGNFEDMLKSKSGKFAVIAFPKYNLWEEMNQLEFNSQMKNIHHSVTGMSYVANIMFSKTKNALKEICIMALIILFIVVFLDFKNLKNTCAALTPTIMTFISVIGIMNLFNISFNPINILALPVILGISVDDGIHITHRFIREKGNLNEVFNGTGRSVLTTSLTTLLAFTSLSFTSHRGLSSLCLLMIFGVTMAYIYSVLLLPHILNTISNLYNNHKEAT